jgi:hypothetical protein
MLPLPAGRDAGAGAPRYTRHRPERTLLYQLVREYYPAFTAQLAAHDRECGAADVQPAGDRAGAGVSPRRPGTQRVIAPEAGTTTGMLIANVPAVYIGDRMSHRLPARAMAL